MQGKCRSVFVPFFCSLIHDTHVMRILYKKGCNQAKESGQARRGHCLQDLAPFATGLISFLKRMPLDTNGDVTPSKTRAFIYFQIFHKAYASTLKKQGTGSLLIGAYGQ